jgi:hypothetical protein
MATVLICRSGNTPYVASTRGVCGHCQKEIWIANSSPTVDETWCIDCGIAEAEKDMAAVTFEPITERQKADIADYYDEKYVARPCDYCGKMYQGPALYCSLECATDDL